MEEFIETLKSQDYTFMYALHNHKHLFSLHFTIYKNTAKMLRY